MVLVTGPVALVAVVVVLEAEVVVVAEGFVADRGYPLGGEGGIVVVVEAADVAAAVVVAVGFENNYAWDAIG